MKLLAATDTTQKTRENALERYFDRDDIFFMKITAAVAIAVSCLVYFW